MFAGTALSQPYVARPQDTSQEDGNFADELEAALSELEASLDFTGVEGEADANNSAPNPLHPSAQETASSTSLSLSEIESTLRELSGVSGGDLSTTATATDVDTYSSPVKSLAENSRLAPTPSPTSAVKPPAKSSDVHAKPPSLPQRNTSSSPRPPPSSSKPPRSPSPKPPPSSPSPKLPPPVTIPSTPPSPPSHAPHSFTGSFDQSNKRSAASVNAPPPDSPKIRSKLAQSFVPPLPPPPQQLEGFQQEEYDEDPIPAQPTAIATTVATAATTAAAATVPLEEGCFLSLHLLRAKHIFI